MGGFENKRVVITGATSGIGRAAAALFGAAGAKVLGVGSSEPSVAAAGELPGVTWLAADARHVQSARHLAEQARERLGGVDVLFLNAGVAQLRPFHAIDEAHFDDHFDVNVKGLVFTLHALLPLLAEGATVVVNTSVAAHKAAPNMAVYAASKGALSALVRTLAVELAPQKIRVNAISPGPTHTAIQDKFGLPPEVRDAVQSSTAQKMPLGRFGQAHEVAQVALFLASDGASFMTGAELPVDGGLLYA